MLRRNKSKMGSGSLPSFEGVENGGGGHSNNNYDDMTSLAVAEEAVASSTIEIGYGGGYASSGSNGVGGNGAGVGGGGGSSGGSAAINLSGHRRSNHNMLMKSLQQQPPLMSPPKGHLTVGGGSSGMANSMKKEIRRPSLGSVGSNGTVNSGVNLSARKGQRSRAGSSGGNPGASGGGGDGMPFSALRRCLFNPSVWMTLFGVICLVMFLQYRSQHGYLLKELNARTLEDVVNDIKRMREWADGDRYQSKALRDQLNSSNEKRMNLEREIRQIRKERDELRSKYDDSSRQKEEAKIVAREEAWRGQVQLLQKATQRESKRAVLDKFGEGPYQVEVALSLPDRRGRYKDDELRYFVVEMAPLEFVPHAVHLFLEQVSHKLWDNSWFYINGPHVMQAGPKPDEEAMILAEKNGEYEHGTDERAIALRPFRELTLETLAFPEYSKDFPHVPWTMGFTGRPGGPDFYINKVDNTLAHGPGGQYQHDIDEFADPCFAQVIRGFAALNELHKLPTITEDADYMFFLEMPAKIHSAVILDKPLPLDQRETASQPNKLDATVRQYVPKEVEPEKEEQLQEVRVDAVSEAAEQHINEEHHSRKHYNPHIEHQVEP